MYTTDHLYLGEGLHDVLRVLLAMIESVSILFRASSLSLRVVCNSIAGHLLLSVLVEMTTSTTWYLLHTMYYMILYMIHSSKEDVYSVSNSVLTPGTNTNNMQQ
jgi:F0F1-type ATP synthase membrane subunit a